MTTTRFGPTPKADDVAELMQGLIGHVVRVHVRKHTRHDDADFDKVITGKVIGIAERVTGVDWRTAPRDVIVYDKPARRVYTFAVTRLRQVTDLDTSAKGES